MTLDEFTHLVESHGVDSERWPDHLQHPGQDLLATSTEAQRLMTRHRQLAQQLDQLLVPEFPGLESRVLSQQLPSHKDALLDQLLAWLLPENPFGKQFWRPAMAACLPLVFGILVGNYFSFGVFIEDDSFEYWEDELAMLALDDYTENSF
jgi:hypothetical protein